MLLRFWGTRGSLPVGLSGQGVRDKVRAALLQADGRSFGNDAALDKFIDEELDFPTSHGFGGNSSCVEIVGGENTVVCDMGSGLRELGQQMMKEFGPGAPRRYDFFMSHVHWDHIMGLPFFCPSLYSRQRDSCPRLPSGHGGSIPAAAVGSVFPGPLGPNGCRH